MKVLDYLACLFALLVTTALANTEKAIFLAPQAISLPHDTPGLDFLQLDTITHDRPALRSSLQVTFPSKQNAYGQDHWYTLRALNEYQRYELRVCWAAIQPTKFWLDVYTLSEAFDTPDLIQSLAAFVEDSAAKRELSSPSTRLPSEEGGKESVLFLHVRAAADFFTTNKTLMLEPPRVHVDLILDPYVFNVFPKSLGPTAVYVIVLAVGAWFLSGRIWDSLRPAASTRPHED